MFEFLLYIVWVCFIAAACLAGIAVGIAGLVVVLALLVTFTNLAVRGFLILPTRYQLPVGLFLIAVAMMVIFQCVTGNLR